MPAAAPTPISKHGTLQSGDLVDVREVDIDQILQLDNQQSATHLFGKLGSPPPDSAVVLERRYTRVWTLQDENGANFLALNKLNSNQRGRAEIRNLGPGVYKLVVRILRAEPSIVSLATKPVGALLSNVTALAAKTQERREQVLARGMPTEYVQVSCVAYTGDREDVLLEVDREELDQSRDELVRQFTVKQDAEGVVELVFVSCSLVKRMRVACDLYRCDLPSHHDLARAARTLMNRALKPQQAPPPPPPSRATKKRVVHLAQGVDAWLVLRGFYQAHCPEKVEDIPHMINFFLKRDGHLGVLFATLEDKYGVKFSPNGKWSE